MWGRKRREADVEPIDILVLCTGNICRSPFIAELLTHRHAGLTVESAGTGALVGFPIAPLSAELLAERGITSDHIARQVTAPMVTASRLILTATAQHRSFAAELDPSAANRTFTIKELARFLGGPPSGPTGLDAVLDAGHKALMKDNLETNDDLPDPWQRPIEAYREMAATVDQTLSVIDPWLG